MLHIVPTPVGNLEDITLRALRILKEADLILAEDTRQTSKLLQHYEIKTQLSAYHKFNERKSCENIVRQLQAGKNIALVSDGGTPCISDPGFILVEACVAEGVEVECLPGATAFVPALVKSGFDTSEFVFLGFLPHKKGRETMLKNIANEKRVVIVYESPFRVVKFLEQALAILQPERKLAISREISKKFEETVYGTTQELLQHFTEKEPRGEFVIVIDKL
ncbi:MAG TPA: 16S rRNA (cytidine(1402)-2'-O)-methyltransferase [Chitinophagales bacterium]